MDIRKDQTLDQLAQNGNVAQFVSFAPSSDALPTQTYSRIWGFKPNHNFKNALSGLSTLLENSPDRSINLRSYTPDDPKSREFIYGLTDIGKAHNHLLRLISQGLFVIANETVDIGDSGVSGVIEAGVIEFSPDDTPRCVEKEGVVSLKTDIGIRLLELVYGFPIKLPSLDGVRIEFSIHPSRRGFHRSHTLLWEQEYVDTVPQQPNLIWPNNFSRMIGDKAFGLLMAELAGLPVPRTTLVSRRIKPFQFGCDTGSSEIWFRTCPIEQEPGRFTTTDKWVDPFALIAKEDPEQNAIASVISQSAILPEYSGAAITDSEGVLQIEGTPGKGDQFMLGEAIAADLPKKVLVDLQSLYEKLESKFGAVRFEWVHDGEVAWVVQLHKGATRGAGTTIVPGNPQKWIIFRSTEGLNKLRSILDETPDEIGLEIDGYIGLTSHMADIIRKANRPARILQSDEPQLPIQLNLREHRN